MKVYLLMSVFSAHVDEFEVEGVYATKESAEAAGAACSRRCVVQEWEVHA